MSYELTEEEKEILEEELCWAKKKLEELFKKINSLIDEKNAYLLEYTGWERRFKVADRKYALATKLTIVGKGKSGKEDGVVKSLEKILNDKDKLKKFIALLEEEEERR